MNLLKRSLFCLAVLCLLVVGAESPLHAQVMGICAGWMESAGFPPGTLSPDCTLATPALEIGTTANPNPTFSIAVNDGGNAANVLLLVLIPQSSTSGINPLTFDVTFSQAGNPDHMLLDVHAFGFPGGDPFVENTALYNNQRLATEYLGLMAVGGDDDWHFNSINNLQVVAGTVAYSVWKLDSGFGVLGPTITSGPIVIFDVTFSDFSVGSGFPIGTMFLALGLDAQGKVIYFTPLTVGLEIVPEPGSLLLLGTGLLGVAGLLRRKYPKKD